MPETNVKIIEATTLDNIKLIHEIRFKVFVDEQKVPTEEELDEFEDKSLHFLLFHEDVAVATLRYRLTALGIKIERMAVLKEFRSFNFGSLLLNYVLEKILNLYPEKTIYLNAQTQALPFYIKNNFREMGDLFYEANIPHKKMTYKKVVNGTKNKLE